MATPSRKGEVESVARTLSTYRPLEYLTLPATLDGGDVMRVGRTLYVGKSQRTNQEGVDQLRRILARFDARVVEVPVLGCLHLKTGCTYLGENTLLANSKLIDTTALVGFEIIEVAPDEPFAANSLRIGEVILYPSNFPRTFDLLNKRHFLITTIDISELQKAEAGLTCMSIIFESNQ